LQGVGNTGYNPAVFATATAVDLGRKTGRKLKTVICFSTPVTRVLRAIAQLTLLFAALEVTPLYAQNLTLLSITPGSGGVSSVIELTASGFQPGVASPPMTVTLTPQVGSAFQAPATAPGTSIGRSIIFTVPAGMPLGTYTVSVSGGTYLSSNTLPFSVVVPAFSLSPASGGQGSTAVVDITGSNTVFANPTLARFGPGIQVGGAAADTLGPVQIISPTVVRATLTIAAGATLGARNVQVLSLDNITQANAFTVVAPLPLTLLSITPGSGGVNAAVVVSATGFEPGVASPQMIVTLTPSTGPSVQVPATAPGTGIGRFINFVIPLGLTPGSYAVSASGPGYQSVNSLPFTAVIPAFTLNPATGARGATLLVDILGTNTTFSSPTFARFGPGIQVGGAPVDTLGPVQVISPTLVRATLTIGAGATLGGHTVQVVSLDDITQANAFTVTGLPQIVSVIPNTGQQNETLSVEITGSNTNFNGSSTVSFGAGVLVKSVAVNGPTSLRAGITVSGGAALGSRDVTVTTNGTPAAGIGLFTVMAAQQSSIRVSPSSGQQGQSNVVVTLTGTNTNFSGASSVSFGPGITVTSIIVGSPTSLTASLNIASNATLGPRDVSVVTSGTTVIGTGLFSVTAPGQTGPLSCTSNTGVPPSLRAEGFTELTGDLLIICTGGTAGQTSAVNLQFFLNTAITSRIANGQSEALLIVDELAGPSAAVYPAIPAQGDNSVVWPNVQFTAPGPGAQRVLRITNVRANATSVGVSTSLVPGQVVAFLSASPSNSLPLSGPQQVVGYVRPGLAFDVTNCNASGSAVAQFAQCSGENSILPRDLINGTNGNVQFALRFAEGFQTAFKTQLASNQMPSTPGIVYNSESGFLRTPDLTYAVGGADSGTRLTARFTNIPAGARLFVTTRPSFGSTSGLNAVLVRAGANGEGNAGQPGLPIAIQGAATLFCPLSGDEGVAAAEIPVDNGSAVAVWEVIATNPAVLESAIFGVAVAYAPNTLNRLPGLGQASVSGNFAPFYPEGSDAGRMSGSLPIPRFLDTRQSNTAFRIDSCVTNLLLPFVTNQSGFDTGIAIANTSRDPFGNASRPQSGTCIVNYYGSSMAGPAPSAQKSSAVDAGSTMTFVLSSGGSHGIAGTPGFQGYMIVQCDFRYAHGFAFITDGPIGLARVAEGYLGLVMDASTPQRGSSSETLRH
jgi:hypothetical protein